MATGCLEPGQDSEAAGHAQVDEQGAAIGPDQQILAAASGPGNPGAGQGFHEPAGYRETEAGLAQVYAGDELAPQIRVYAPSGGFYLR